MARHPINKEWLEYYQMLEAIRRSGIVNMYGAATVLADMKRISLPLATQVLASWMENYAELKRRFNW